jgi:deoxyribodipyrimidine photo-lyase
MKQVLWFRRDLRVVDSEILANAKDEVLPIFIFDKNILNKLPKDDKRVTFIYKTVLELKENLQKIGLDLAIFYANPKDVFIDLNEMSKKIIESESLKKYDLLGNGEYPLRDGLKMLIRDKIIVTIK